MATPLTADQMLSALRAEGCDVREYKSWRTHNRNHKGAWGGVNGIVIHHTAGVSSGMVDLCYNGYVGLPGPICHAVLTKAATTYLVGHGRTNHAGTFARNAHNAVIAESSTHPRPDRAEPIDGNRHYYGLEIENKGDGKDPYPSDQYDQAVRYAAAICRAHRWTADSVIGHKEGTRRKIDPSFPVNTFRRDVAARLKLNNPAGEVTGTPPQPKETPMAVSDADADKIARAVLTLDGEIDAPWGTPTNQEWMLKSCITHLVKAVLRTEKAVKELGEAVPAELEEFEVAPVNLTDEQVAALADRVVTSDALADRIAEKVAANLADRLAE